VYATVGVASRVVTAFSLRRLGRAVVWNVFLKCIGVGVEKRRELALKTAELDLRRRRRRATSRTSTSRRRTTKQAVAV
jgi:hypothetical protein